VEAKAASNPQPPSASDQAQNNHEGPGKSPLSLVLLQHVFLLVFLYIFYLFNFHR
jgi:hypothetical protein